MTEKEALAIAAAVFDVAAAEDIPSDTTLRDLRILTSIAISEVVRAPYGVVSLARSLSLPVPAVSRAVHSWVAVGVLQLLPHPTDGRRSVIRHTTQTRRNMQLWAAALSDRLALSPAR
jgi:DNA-binding MarR family transcriptional regulator